MLRELLIDAPFVVKIPLKDVLGFVEVKRYGHPVPLSRQQVSPAFLLGGKATISRLHLHKKPVKAAPANSQEQVWNSAPNSFSLHCCRHRRVTLATVWDCEEQSKQWAVSRGYFRPRNQGDLFRVFRRNKPLG